MLVCSVSSFFPVRAARGEIVAADVAFERAFIGHLRSGAGVRDILCYAGARRVAPVKRPHFNIPATTRPGA